MRPPGPGPITIKPKGFAAFATIQGDKAPINRGVEQTPEGWYGWQRNPTYKTALYPTRSAAKEALFRDAPQERQ